MRTIALVIVLLAGLAGHPGHHGRLRPCDSVHRPHHGYVVCSRPVHQR